jgi:hypothetical protein
VDLFRVFFFNPDGTNQEETLTPVPAAEAVGKAYRLVNSLPAQAGSITEVRIIDSGDACVFHWIYGQGVVFPPRPPGLPHNGSHG